MDLLFFEPDDAREKKVALMFNSRLSYQRVSQPDHFLEAITDDACAIALVDVDHFTEKERSRFLKTVKTYIPTIKFFGLSSAKDDSLSRQYAEIDMPVVRFNVNGLNELAVLVKYAVEKTGLENARSESPDDLSYIGESPIIRGIVAQVKLIQNSDFHILITGETGSGKTELARYIHHNSRRKNAPFMHINCAAIPDSLIEAELFGYKKGAFTGAVKNMAGKFKAAEKGTICLDEIGEIPMHLQAKLLKVLDEKQYFPVGSTSPEIVQARIIAATNKDISKAVKSRKFREDLYYRLNTFELNIPALRDRPEDVPELFNFFIGNYANENQIGIPEIDPQVYEVLVQYSWDGNIRELLNLVQLLMYTSPSKIEINSMPQHFFEGPKAKLFRAAAEFKPLELIKKDYAKQVFELNNKSKMKTARLLGVNIKTLNKLLA